MPRGYNPGLIDKECKRIESLPGNSFCERRELALEKRIKLKEANERVVIPVDYNPYMPKISSIFYKHHKAMITSNPELKKTFPKSPMAALRQPPNLRKLLCKSKLYSQISRKEVCRTCSRIQPSWKKCGKSCPICSYALPACKNIEGTFSHFKHEFKENLNCNTKNCIYYWTCIKDNCIDQSKMNMLEKLHVFLRKGSQSTGITLKDMSLMSHLVNILANQAIMCRILEALC